MRSHCVCYSSLKHIVCQQNMPWVRVRTTERGLVDQEVYERAFSDVSRGDSMRRAAKVHGVCHVTLYRYCRRTAEMSGLQARAPEYGSHKKVFTEDQEKRLQAYIFGPLKHYIDSAVDNWMRMNAGKSLIIYNIFYWDRLLASVRDGPSCSITSACSLWTPTQPEPIRDASLRVCHPCRRWECVCLFTCAFVEPCQTKNCFFVTDSKAIYLIWPGLLKVHGEPESIKEPWSRSSAQKVSVPSWRLALERKLGEEVERGEYCFVFNLSLFSCRYLILGI